MLIDLIDCSMIGWKGRWTRGDMTRGQAKMGAIWTSKKANLLEEQNKTKQNRTKSKG
jgi:hypothetical protein